MLNRKANKARKASIVVPAAVTLDVTSRESVKRLSAKSINQAVKTDMRMLRKFSFS